MTEAMTNATPRGPYRRFTADDGSEWLVWLLSESAVEEIREAPSVGRAWLIFLGPDGQTRRFAPVPKGWRRLPALELSKLAARAKAFAARQAP